MCRCLFDIREKHLDLLPSFHRRLPLYLLQFANQACKCILLRHFIPLKLIISILAILAIFESANHGFRVLRVINADKKHVLQLFAEIIPVKPQSFSRRHKYQI